MKAYKMAMKAARKGFYVSSTSSASSCLAQLFRPIRPLTTLPPDIPNDRELAIG